MNQHKQRLEADIGTFIKQYARKAQRGQEPNDRRYSRRIERKIKRMKPDELDKLIQGTEDDARDQT